MIWFESFSASAATCTRSAPRHDQDQKTLTDSAHKDESTSPRQAEPGRAREERPVVRATRDCLLWPEQAVQSGWLMIKRGRSDMHSLIVDCV